MSVQSELMNNTLSVYPNPARDLVYVNTQDMGSIQVVSAFGELVYQRDIEDNLTEINVSAYAKGAYILYYKTDSGIRSRKIIVY
jgi:hypothetical protein